MIINKKFATHFKLSVGSGDAEALSKSLLDNIQDIVYRYRLQPSPGFEYVSPSVLKITGYKPREYYNEPQLMLKVIHDEDRAKQQSILDGRGLNGEPVLLRRIKKDGTVIWTEQRDREVHDSQGQLIAIEGIIRDISVRMESDMDLVRKYREGALHSRISAAIINIADEMELIASFTAIVGESAFPESFGVLLRGECGMGLVFSPSYRNYRFPEQIIQCPEDSGKPELYLNKLASSGDVTDQIPRFNMHPFLNSEISAPIIIAGELIGFLNAASSNEKAYLPADKDLLATLAVNLSTSIQKLRYQQGESEQKKFADALQETALVLNQSLDTDKILDHIMSRIKEVIPAEGENIMLLEEDHLSVVRYSKFGIETQIHKQTCSVPLINIWPSLVQMKETREPLLIADTSKAEDWEVNPGEEWIRSYLSAPIVINGGPVTGFINLNHSKANFFTEKHAAQLKAFTTHVALALSNSNLYAETQLRIKETLALYDTSQDTSGEHHLETLLEAIISRAAGLVPVEVCGFYLYDESSMTLEIAASTNSVIPLGTRIKIGEGAAGLVAQTHEPLMVDDYQTWDNRAGVYSTIPFSSLLEVPMLYGGQLVGVLFACELAPKRYQFKETDRQLLSMLANSAAGAVYNSRQLTNANNRLSMLEALHNIENTISNTFDSNLTLNVVLDQVMEQLKIDAADLYLFQQDRGRLTLAGAKGFRNSKGTSPEINLSQSLAGNALMEHKRLEFWDLDQIGENDLRHSMFEQEGFISYMGVPLIAKGQYLGVLEIFLRAPFTPSIEWMNFLEALAGQAAVAIENINLFHQLQKTNADLVQAYDATIEGWARALELRDMETEGHSRRVVGITMKLAQQMGLNGQDLVHIRRGALLHDIGKMGVPDSILQKPGSLDSDEWEIIKQHPVLAEEWLSSIHFLQAALDIPYCHHEKWDGTGYPRQLQGADIPLSARIFAIVDVYDALNSDRPYRASWEKERIIEFLIEQKGIHFDPEVVDCFLELFEAGEIL